MHAAAPEACQGPVLPGRGHPDPTLSQIFRVTDSANHQYLVGWQIVPYQGPHTYRFGTAGNLLALEPPASGAPLGFATGTITIGSGATSGSVDAIVNLSAGGLVNVTGAWSCSPGRA